MAWKANPSICLLALVASVSVDAALAGVSALRLKGFYGTGVSALIYVGHLDRSVKCEVPVLEPIRGYGVSYGEFTHLSQIV
jgi:hypothetical protein